MLNTMSGIDHLLASVLEAVILKNLGVRACQKIQNRLYEKFGITILEAIEQFQTIDSILRELFGKGADGLERKFLDSVCTLKSEKTSERWLSINDKEIMQVILESIGDEDKKRILLTTAQEPKITYDILKKCNIPQTSGYRKINSLIDSGLLYQSEYVIGNDGKKISKYLSTFSNLKINVKEGEFYVDIQLNEDQLKESTILQVVYNI